MSTESNKLCLFKDTDDEVELISLTFETLPRYRLRADCNIQFSGYQHSDFQRADQVKENLTELSNEQIEKTLEYFLLCGLRVNKMTETFEDCAALRLLVEEQKAHMDEAANIGLNLLQRNIQLEQRLNTVEDQLEASKETINQLKHQLHLKDDLLRLLHNEIEEAEEDTSCSSHIEASVSIDTTFTFDKVNLKLLESKLNKLEEENSKLRNQHTSLNSHTDFLENKEQQLIDDCVRQLLDSTKTVDRLSADLNKKTNDYLNQHEEISRLLTTNIDLDNKIHQLLTENDNLVTQFRDHQMKQFTLTKELSELRDRYDECINLLNERQDQIRQLKKQCKREMVKQIQGGCRSCSPDIPFAPSLAMEFEDSNKKDNLIADQSRAIRVMEQARNINSCLLDIDETSSGFTDDLSCSIINTEMDSSVQESSGGNYLLRKSIQEDCEKRRLYRNNPVHIDSSLIDSNISEVSVNTMASYCAMEAYRHRQNRCQTIRSLNTNILNSEPNNIHNQNSYRIPDKLQLVKPIEGSQTLRTWQNLATPSITKALFEEQSHSVCFRGQQPLVLSPSPSSPSSEHSHSSDFQHSLNSSMIYSDYDDVDFDEPITLIQSKCPSTISVTSACTSSNVLHSSNGKSHHSNVTKSSNIINPTVNHRLSSGLSLDLELSSNVNEHVKSCRDNILNYQDDTPVNEMNTLHHYSPLGGVNYEREQLPITSNERTMPSWLDRLTVKSIMTSILGYPLPHLHRAIASSGNNYTNGISSTVITSPSVTSSTVQSSHNPSSLIGRLTNLPPLAQRRMPQSGLNLLTSVASSISQSCVVHRMINDDDLTPPSEQELTNDPPYSPNTISPLD